MNTMVTAVLSFTVIVFYGIVLCWMCFVCLSDLECGFDYGNFCRNWMMVLAALELRENQSSKSLHPLDSIWKHTYPITLVALERRG